MLREYGNLERIRLFRARSSARGSRTRWLVVDVLVRRRLQLPRRVAEGRLAERCRGVSSRSRSTSFDGRSAAQRSRRDLRRVNGMMGAPVVGARWRRIFVETSVDIGSAAPPPRARRRRRPPAAGLAGAASRAGRKVAVLLDPQPPVAGDARRLRATVGARVPGRGRARLGRRPPSTTMGLMFATLFLHHFEGARRARLLAGIARLAERSSPASRAARLRARRQHLLGALGGNEVTRQTRCSACTRASERELSAGGRPPARGRPLEPPSPGCAARSSPAFTSCFSGQDGGRER